MKWIDFSWRLPVAVLVRAPIMVLGVGFEWLGGFLQRLGDMVPGLPYYMPWTYKIRP